MIHLRSAPSIIQQSIHPSGRLPFWDSFTHQSTNRYIHSPPNSCIHGPTIEIIFQLALHPIIHPSRHPAFLPTICWLILQYLSAPSIIHLGIQPSIIFFHFTIQGFVPPLSGDSIHQSIHPFFPKSLPSVAPQSISSFIRQSIQSSTHHTLFYQLIHPSIVQAICWFIYQSSSSNSTPFLLYIDPCCDSTVHLSIQTSIKSFAHPSADLFPFCHLYILETLCHLKNTLSQAIHRFIHQQFVHQCILPSVHPSNHPVNNLRI